MDLIQLMPFIWIGVAVFLAVVEMSSNQLVSIWFVLGAVVSAITAIFTGNIFVQVIVFIVVSAVCLVATRPFIKKITKTKKVSTNADSLIGQTGIVTIEIDNLSTQGQVKVNGQIWTARSKDGNIISVNEKVKVLEISGVKLIVTPEKTNWKDVNYG